MSHEPTVIYSAANTQQAHLLRGLLEQEGIAASVVNDAIQIAGGDLPVGWTAAPRIVVAEEDALAARRLAEEFDRRTAHEPSGDSAEAEPLSAWSEWPVCPSCGQRRAARCPVCGVSRTDFLLADVQEDGGQQQVLLKCDDCDDLIRPQWYRLCARCGYDYGAGIVVSVGAQENSVSARSSRTIVLLLVAVGGALIGYFAWLLGRPG